MKTSILCSLGLAGSLAANASVAYFNGPPFAVSLDFTVRESLDVDRDGVADFAFSSGPSLSGGFLTGVETPVDVASGPGNTVLIDGFGPAVLSAGVSIGGAASGSIWSTNELGLAAFFVNPGSVIFTSHGWVTNAPESGWGGPLAIAGNGFLGISFTNAGGTHYGWIHAALQDNVMVLDWAYETQPDTAILAGAAPVAALRASTVVRPGNLRLQWASQAGVAYQVQFKTDFGSPAWSNLGFTFIATSEMSAIDVPITGDAAFYRVVESN